MQATRGNVRMEKVRRTCKGLGTTCLRVGNVMIVRKFCTLITKFIVAAFIFGLIKVVGRVVGRKGNFGTERFCRLKQRCVFYVNLVYVVPILLKALRAILTCNTSRLVGSLTGNKMCGPRGV